ncbi:hypothetical protein BKI52_21085 [marine bacterium AO1-C]|nr:hypothetical protein BKI52_21085 [marine bacterium AO1-C]
MSQSTDHQESTFDIAIVVCTYNPKQEIFVRLLDAINKLRYDQPERIECIIVDNNSTPALKDIPYVVELLDKCPFKASIYVEKEQGLTFARIAGVQNTSAPVVIFFDDDNEPDPEYLKGIQEAIKQHEFVGIWGPGQINVDFLGKIPSKIEGHLLGTFQQRNHNQTRFANTLSFTEAHPYGTGMVCKREALKNYLTAIEQQALSASDRKGNSLASAGDTQILLSAINQGWAVGTSPLLKLNHIIPPSRTTSKYIKRLAFSTSMTGNIAKIEIFPDTKKHVALPSNKYFIYKTCKIFMGEAISNNRYFAYIKLARYFGTVIGHYQILGKQVPKWMNRLAKMLGFVQ